MTTPDIKFALSCIRRRAPLLLRLYACTASCMVYTVSCLAPDSHCYATCYPASSLSLPISSCHNSLLHLRSVSPRGAQSQCRASKRKQSFSA